MDANIQAPGLQRNVYSRDNHSPDELGPGSARFNLRLTHYGKRSIFAANRRHWPHGVGADLDMQMDQTATTRAGGIFVFQSANRCSIVRRHGHYTQ